MACVTYSTGSRTYSKVPHHTHELNQLFQIPVLDYSVLQYIMQLVAGKIPLMLQCTSITVKTLTVIDLGPVSVTTLRIDE